MTADPMPDRISRCARGGYHSRGAGPCFETIEEAIAFRDAETARLADWCDARKDKGFWNDREWITWREQWNKQGWPDGRSSDDR